VHAFEIYHHSAQPAHSFILNVHCNIGYPAESKKVCDTACGGMPETQSDRKNV